MKTIILDQKVVRAILPFVALSSWRDYSAMHIVAEPQSVTYVATTTKVMIAYRRNLPEWRESEHERFVGAVDLPLSACQPVCAGRAMDDLWVSVEEDDSMALCSSKALRIALEPKRGEAFKDWRGLFKLASEDREDCQDIVCVDPDLLRPFWDLGRELNMGKPYFRNSRTGNMLVNFTGATCAVGLLVPELYGKPPMIEAPVWATGDYAVAKPQA